MIPILLSGGGLGIAIAVLVFVNTRQLSPGAALAANIINPITIAISTATITRALAHLGEPQACWLVAEMLGVAIDACTP